MKPIRLILLLHNSGAEFLGFKLVLQLQDDRNVDITQSPTWQARYHVNWCLQPLFKHMLMTRQTLTFALD